MLSGTPTLLLPYTTVQSQHKLHQKQKPIAFFTVGRNELYIYSDSRSDQSNATALNS
jgi:hypothetical protein